MDGDLRTLERAYQSDPALLPRLNQARVRVGLKPIRPAVIHYVKANVHYRIGADGKFSPRFGTAAVQAACRNVEVWPRAFFPPRSRDSIHYTADREQVSCKHCVKIISSQNFVDDPAPAHLRVEVQGRAPYAFCGAAITLPTTLNRYEVGCPTCREKFSTRPDLLSRNRNSRARRRVRRADDRLRAEIRR